MSDPSHKTLSPNSNPLEIEGIINGNHSNPFGFLGLHSIPKSGGMVVRVFRPGATKVWILVEGKKTELVQLNSGGFFAMEFPTRKKRFEHQLVIQYGKEIGEPVADSFSFGEILGEQDLYFFGEGSDRDLWKKMGAQIKTLDGVHQQTSGEYLFEGAEVHFTSPRDALSHGIATVYQDLMQKYQTGK